MDSQVSASPMDEIAIALGSNLGDSLANLQGALKLLDEHADISLLCCSSWYRTSPVGPPQPDYLNGCALLKTTLSPQSLLQQLLAIELVYGRERGERWGPRSLDLDILLYGDVVVTTESLQIPHPRMCERAFVLVPLAEIAPDWIEPVTGLSVASLCAAVEKTGVERLQEG
jgi:2-amino-4-hydroxy-6-hydroxymethyldihydropteridine diphosphokinase